MGLMDDTTTGIEKRPHVMIIMAPDGAGKTTFAATAPKPYFLGAESGSAQVNVTRAKHLDTLDKFTKKLDELYLENHDFKTVVIDTLDWLEPIVYAHVCRKNDWDNIEAPGYGKGPAAALVEWGKLISKIDLLVERKGMNFIGLVHPETKTITPPGSQLAYDRSVLAMNQKAAAKWRQFVDLLLFVNFEDQILQSKGSKSKGVAFKGEERIAYTQRRAAHDAKNRFGLPYNIPFTDFAGLVAEIEKAQGVSGEALKKQVEELCSQLLDETLRSTVAESIKTATSDDQLRSFKRRLMEIIETQTSQEGEK